MKAEDKVRRLLLGLINDAIPRQVEVCQVVSVDETALTCKVKELHSELDIYDVRLNAGKTTSKVVLIPKVDSYVLIGIIGNSKQARYVVSVSEVDKVVVDASTSILINSGTNKGLVKVDPLKSKLNTIENDINTLKNLISTWTVVANDGGGALKTKLATWVTSTLTPTTLADIENDKVKH